MNFAFFISSRYILSNKDSRLLNLVSVITIIGIALGVATLVIALSVLSGFEKTLTQKITDFDSHINISSYSEKLPNSDIFIYKVNSKIIDQIDFTSLYLSKLAIINSKKRTEGITIKGILDGKISGRIKSNIVDGNFSFNNDDELLIGKTLATKLLIKVGDKVTLFALKNDEIPSANNLPNIKRFIVSGIFESGMAEYDNMFGYTTLKSAQNLFGMNDAINGIDIKLKSIDKVDSLNNLIKAMAHYPYHVNSIFEIHKNIFTWIELQKKPIPIILGLIILVAVFNIIGALLILVLEKTNAIGIIKSLGAKSSQVIKIFLYQGMYLSIIGIIVGNILAFLLMYIQIQFNIIKVPASVYFVTKVPIEMSSEIFFIVSGISFMLALIVSFIPSYFASKTNPVSALRFD